jgi:putative transposase
MLYRLNPLHILFIAASRKDLVRQLEYLKVENQILRSKLGRQVRLTARERERLIIYGRRVGMAIRHLVSIVTPHTFDRWLNGSKWRKGTKPRKPGRPRTPDELQALVVRIARETGWGYTRILGELKKLGVNTVSRSTVVNILKRAGLDPSPERAIGTWDQFLKRHAETLWACDFLPRKLLTFRGWRDAYLLIFIHIQSRRVWVSPATFNPTRRWTATQAVAFCQAQADSANAPRIILHDRDTKFFGAFHTALRKHSIQPVPLRVRSPNLNAFAERFIQTLQQECLDHFVACGTKHLDYLVREFVEHYHTERPHQGLENRIPFCKRPMPTSRAGPVRCARRLGGCLKHYYRNSAWTNYSPAVVVTMIA